MTNLLPLYTDDVWTWVCLFCVAQVIEEIEEMMQESPDPEDDESPSQSDLSMLSQDLHALKRSGSNTSYEDREYLRWLQRDSE